MKRGAIEKNSLFQYSPSAMYTYLSLLATPLLGQIFYKLIYGIFFSDLGLRGRKKIKKSFLFFLEFYLFFLISPEKTVKQVR